MADLLISDNGRVRRKADVELAEKVMELKRKKDHWAVIDLLLKAWAERSPDEEQALQLEIKDHREMLVDKKYGTTQGGKGQERRFKLVFPHSLMLLIRTQYKADELQMDDAFFNEFVKRYPAFRVAEKI
jgi:hypothetical protein